MEYRLKISLYCVNIYIVTKEEFISEFEELIPALKSFLVRMTASVQDTEDIVQESYIKAGG